MTEFSDLLGGLLVGTLIGVIVETVIMQLTISPIIISQEAGDEICHKLTNNSLSVSSVNTQNKGKLICTIPSFDSTTQIIVKKAGAE